MESVCEEETSARITLCISRFNEDIRWINNPEFAKFAKVIYNKGNVFDASVLGQACEIISLDNVGREGHTYLHHIIEHYDNLDEITVFLPGSCMGELKIDTTQRLIKRVCESSNTVIMGAWYDQGVHQKFASFQIDSWEGSNSKNKTLQPERACAPSSIRPFSRWYKNFFGDVFVRVACFGGLFAVHKKHILQHSQEYYRQLISTLDQHSNPEDGHFMERSWAAVFHPIPVFECKYFSLSTLMRLDIKYHTGQLFSGAASTTTC